MEEPFQLDFDLNRNEPEQLPPPQAEEEEDVCRVCRAGSEEGELFYPCQCTGSIRYVHEECLNEWLRRSKKDNCELCDTPLEFTKVFSPSMPEIVPIPVLMRHFVLSITRGILFVLRAIVVAVAWLAVLPYLSLWIFRFYLWSAHGVATFLRLVTSPSPSIPTSAFNKTINMTLAGTGTSNASVTIQAAVGNAMSLASVQAMEHLLKDVLGQPGFSTNPIGNLTALGEYQARKALAENQHDLWRRLFHTLARDTFSGQIITSVVVVLFVCGFLLREWIVMNHPMGNNNPDEDPAPVNPDLLRANIPPIAHVENGRNVFEGVIGTADIPEDVEDATDVPDDWEDVKDDQEEAEEGQSMVWGGQTYRSSRFVEENIFSEVGYEDEEEEDDKVEGLPMSPETRSHFETDARRRRTERHEMTDELAAGEEESAATWNQDATKRHRSSSVPVGSSTPAATSSSTNVPRAQSAAIEAFNWPDFNDTPAPPFPSASVPAATLPTPTPIDALNPPPPPLEHVPTPAERLIDLVNEAAANNGLAIIPPPAPVPGPNNPFVLNPEPNFNLIPEAGAPANNNGIPPLLGEDGQPIDGEEVFEGDLMDDFEGVLEAIGMRGSLLVLVQNMGLMNLLMAICLGGALWIPLMVGKALAAGNAIRLVALPLRAVRIISDPIFDFAFAIISWAPKLLFSVVGSKIPISCSSLSLSALQTICTAFFPTSNSAILVSDIVNSTLFSEPNSTSLAFDLLATNTTLAAPAPITAGEFIKTSLESIVTHWHKMAFVDDSFHRALCVALGYTAIFLGGLWYLHSTQNAYSQSVSRAIAEGISQQLTLIKVAIFVFVEIVVFPAICGILMNLATLPLFADATIYSRIAYYQASPVSGLFLTWLTGTVYMFLFACGIDGIREVVRKGTIWFIKDPSADFHPIRDILERKSITQARKILISAFLYGTSIFLSVGVNTLFLRYAVGVLPLRWINERAFSLPIDLLFFRFMIPVAIDYTDPRTRLSKLFIAWAKCTAHELRLTSFIFGGDRDPTEEGSHIRKNWKARLTLKKADPRDVEIEHDGQSHISARDVEFRKDGGFGRVPAIDNVRIAPKRSMIVAVTEEGHPLDEAGALVIAAQLVEMGSTRPKDKYCVVYLPPHFKIRVALFIYLLWFTGSLAGMSMVIGPLLLGRYLFTFLTPNPVHDLYSLSIGIYLVTAITLGVRKLASLRNHRLSARATSMALNLVAASIGTAVLLPTLTAFLIKCYVFSPLSWYRPSSNIYTVDVLQEWATGTVVISLVWNLARFLPDGSLKTSLGNLKVAFGENDLEASLKQLNRIVWPLILKSLFLVVAPGVVAWCQWKLVLANTGWWRLVQGQEAAPATYVQVCRLVYGITAAFLASRLASRRAEAYASKWVAGLREREYLLQRKLKNYEGDPAKADKSLHLAPASTEVPPDTL